MSYFFGTASYSTANLKTITCGFQPVRAKITIGSIAGGENAIIHQSVGVTDGTNQLCDSFADDGTNLYQNRFTDRMVSHYVFAAGVPTETTKATFSSFTATQFKFTVNTANVNYQYFIEVWG